MFGHYLDAIEVEPCGYPAYRPVIVVSDLIDLNAPFLKEILADERILILGTYKLCITVKSYLHARYIQSEDCLILYTLPSHRSNCFR